ncbi:hypothetical protein EKO23_01150 [Nocardioides guangzhouensis]|uniref:Uncharacterized protein n=1 Tax=Nocardioides guangzhouensis TaxID=2497878 RepID=A0A4Q4ZNJ7_9ACTN|nr:Ig-like domain-containing protein [Nocardioides guangzhouensis]RYP89064.1 hypothetical protein EKO23_01150 [Nocardioides guangzhouensis]
MAALTRVIAGLLMVGAVVVSGGGGAAVGSPAVPLNDCVSSDNGDPVLTGLTVTPAVDVTDVAHEVTFSLTAEDLGGPGPASGLRRVEISFGDPLVDDPFDTYHALHKDATGAWTGSVTVQPGSSPGRWTINGVFLRDGARNSRALWTEDLEQAGFPTTVDVISIRDTSRPRIVDFRSTPGPVDTRRASRVVTFTATVADPVPGVGELYLVGSMGGESISEGSYDGDFVDLSPADSPDTFQGSMRVRQWVGSGTWKISSVFVMDKVGNFRSYSHKRLGELGFRRQLTILSRDDIRPPELARLALRPSHVDVRTEDGRLVVRTRAVDGRSGVHAVNVYVGHRFLALERVAGTRRDGVWTGVVTLPRCTSNASDRRVAITVTDGALNQTYYPPSALAARGWPDRVAITAADHRRPRARLLRWRVTPAGPVTVRFSEIVSGVTAESATVRRVFAPHSENPTFGPPVAGGWRCRSASAAVVSCESGRVARATFVPDARLLARRTYQLTLNPEFTLAITDRSGNPFDRAELWFDTTA